MKTDRLILSKIIIFLGFFVLTGIPLILLRKIFLPSQVHFVVGILSAIAFILLWRDLLSLKKDWQSWTFAGTVCIMVLLRPFFIPPFVFKIFDLFFILITLSIIYRPSRIKSLLVFTSCLILPLSMARIYGFMPSSYMSLMLLFGGAGIGVIWPGLQSDFFRKDAKSLDMALCLLIVVLLKI